MTNSTGETERYMPLSHDEPIDEVRAIMTRLDTERSRLEWAVNFAQVDLKSISRGRLDDLCLEALVFGFLGGAELGGQADTLHTALPTKTQLLQVQKAFTGIISTLLEHGSVPIRSFMVSFSITVFEGKARRFTWVSGSQSDGSEHYMEALAIFTLALLLGNYGHLVKACPAPKPRSHEGEVCGRWFVGRPNQTYCSPLCQNRATTRSSREKRQSVSRNRRGRKPQRKE